MSKKIVLAVTLAQLQTFSVPVLKAYYNEVAGKPAPKSEDANVILDALLEAAEPLPEQETQQGKSLPQFTYKGKKYQLLMPKVQIPTIGERTAIELATDEDAIEHLIKIGCVGTVFREVL